MITRGVLALTTFFILWSSPRPIVGADVIVYGGQLRTVTIAADGLSGEIDATADHACLTVDYALHTADGLTLRNQYTWWDECPKVFIPLVRM